ncbi:MAG: hypothetical protein JJU10_00670 [Idiomarina sp.]|nr:hypothetical protein [Idiomarina sp.]
MCDALMHAVESALPLVSFETVVMPQTRIGVQMERAQNVCFPCMIYTGTEHERVYMTRPTHWYPPHGVITTPELAEQLTRKFGNPIRLTELLQNSHYRFGYPDGRRYGQLQPVLDEFANDGYRVVRTGEHATVALLAMIRAGRIQYTIDYPQLVEYDQRISQQALTFIPISEIEGHMILGAIGCTKGDWGAHMIEQINAALPDVHDNAAFLENLAMWFNSTQDYFERYERFVRDFKASDPPN